MRGQYFVQSQRFWAASKPTAGQEPHVVNLGAMHINYSFEEPWSNDHRGCVQRRLSLTAANRCIHMYEDTLRPITATAANQRLHMYEIRGGGQSPLRQRPQPTSVYICKNTLRPITATAAIQCLHMYERRRGRSLKPTSVYESRRGGSLITIKSRLRFWCRWM